MPMKCPSLQGPGNQAMGVFVSCTAHADIAPCYLTTMFRIVIFPLLLLALVSGVSLCCSSAESAALKFIASCAYPDMHREFARLGGDIKLVSGVMIILGIMCI